jgi:hypothetical protein
MGTIHDNAGAAAPAADDDVALAPPAATSEDTATLAPAPEPVAPAAAVPTDATVPVEGDDVNVARLRALLGDLKTKLSKKNPSNKDAQAAARVNLQLTKLLVHMPKVPLLDVYLQFLRENADGVAAREKFLLGSTTLGSTDERQVCTLYSLFMDVVDGLVLRVNNSEITKILEKPEFAAYFHRKVAVLAQQRNQAG